MEITPAQERELIMRYMKWGGSKEEGKRIVDAARPMSDTAGLGHLYYYKMISLKTLENAQLGKPHTYYK